MSDSIPTRRWTAWVAAIWLIAASVASADEAADLVGTYWNVDRSRRIEITQDAGVFTGRIVWESEAAREAQGDQLGREILRRFRFRSEDDEWVGGEVVSPIDGTVYRGKLWLVDGDLMMRGFIGFSLFGRTAKMERVR